MRLPIIWGLMDMPPPMPAPDFAPLPACIWPIIAIPSCMAFMCSDIRACRSSGVLAVIIFSCISCMAFICMSIWAAVGAFGDGATADGAAAG